MSLGRYLSDVKLYLGTYGSRSQYVAPDIEIVSSFTEWLVQCELIAASFLGNGCTDGIVTIEKLQGSGVNHAFVLCQVERDGGHLVRIHHARCSHKSRGKVNILLLGDGCCYVVVT